MTNYGIMHQIDSLRYIKKKICIVIPTILSHTLDYNIIIFVNYHNICGINVL